MRWSGFHLVILTVYSVFSMLTSPLEAAELRFSTQNAYVSWPEFSPAATVAPNTRQSGDAPKTAGINNRVWSMNGSALHASKGDSVEAFLAYSESQIRERLQSYLQTHLTLNPMTDDLIILDMEHPVHPKHLGGYTGAKQVQIIEAFKTRIKVARQVFPHAKLSLYGVIVPTATGNSLDRKFETIMQGYRRAGELGMFDNLDYLSPVLYLRFGPQDKKYNTVEASMRQGIEASYSLKTSRGTSLPLAPLLSFKVYNGHSDEHRQCVSSEPLQKQIKIAQEYPYVQIIVLWAGPQVIVDCTPQKLLQELALQTAR